MAGLEPQRTWPLHMSRTCERVHNNRSGTNGSTALPKRSRLRRKKTEATIEDRQQMPVCVLSTTPESQTSGTSCCPRLPTAHACRGASANRLQSIAQGFSGGSDDVPRPTGPVAVGPVGGTAGFTGGKFSDDKSGSAKTGSLPDAFRSRGNLRGSRAASEERSEAGRVDWAPVAGAVVPVPSETVITGTPVSGSTRIVDPGRGGSINSSSGDCSSRRSRDVPEAAREDGGRSV